MPEEGRDPFVEYLRPRTEDELADALDEMVGISSRRDDAAKDIYEALARIQKQKDRNLDMERI